MFVHAKTTVNQQNAQYDCSQSTDRNNHIDKWGEGVVPLLSRIYFLYVLMAAHVLFDWDDFGAVMIRQLT